MDTAMTQFDVIAAGVDDPELENIIGGGITDGESKPKSKEWFPYDAKMVRVPVATLSCNLALRLSV